MQSSNEKEQIALRAVQEIGPWAASGPTHTARIANCREDRKLMLVPRSVADRLLEHPLWSICARPMTTTALRFDPQRVW